MSYQPIGIFDSGVGGTSIWKEIHHYLPREDTVYLADSNNAPYGEKSRDEIIKLSVKNTERLLEMGAKLIIVACNTATTNAIDYLRAHYSLPFIGIEPAIKPAALNSVTGTVGVLATKGTLSSHLFSNTSRLHASGIRIIEQEGTGLVSLIEAGKVRASETRELLKKFLQPMIDAQIDSLVLGCTHYPYLVPVLKELLPEGVQIIDCGEAVARQTGHILRQYGLLKISGGTPRHEFYTNGDLEILKAFLEDTPGNPRISHLSF